METANLYAQLIERFEHIKQLLREVNSQWPLHVVDAEVFQIPFYPTPEPPKEIHPIHFSDHEAVNLIQKVLLQFEWQEVQLPTQAARYPGIIRLNKSFTKKFNAINETKDELHALMTDHLTPGNRAKVRDKLFGSISMVQVYRHIFSYEQTPRKVVFSWIGNTFSVKKMSIPETVKFLDSKRSLAPDYLDFEEWNQIIDAEISLLANPPPNATVQLKKRIAPHPRMMTFLNAYDRPDQKISTQCDFSHHANLPLFLVDPKQETIINPLKSFQQNDNYTQRRRRIETRPLIEKLNLFWASPIE